MDKIAFTITQLRINQRWFKLDRAIAGITNLRIFRSDRGCSIGGQSHALGWAWRSVIQSLMLRGLDRSSWSSASLTATLLPFRLTNVSCSSFRPGESAAGYPSMPAPDCWTLWIWTLFWQLCFSSHKVQVQSLLCNHLPLWKDANPSRSIERLSSDCFWLG